MRIHLIAIGGSAMHNMAIALKNKAYDVTGSDDEIFEPSKSRLQKHGLLPNKIGWDPTRITDDIDVVILGMHARMDNPELLEAIKKGIKVYSYPEYFYYQTQNKKRIVISGSHGKTTVTSMLMHVLKFHGLVFDYLVGAQIEGFETMVKIGSEGEFAIIEGDEYLSSPIDRRPKFHWYKPDIAVLTGIAWDHINVFPTFDDYLRQFSMFVELINKDGCLIWYEQDENIKVLIENKHQLRTIPYTELEYNIINNNCEIIYKDKRYDVPVFGKHNMQNLNCARLVCKEIGISSEDFFRAIISFKGASKRMQLVKKNDSSAMYIDFAHAPSKLKATVDAMKEKYPKRTLVACIELHTFSSLNARFLSEYYMSMTKADYSVIYFNPKVIEHKQLETISPEMIKSAFGNNPMVFTDTVEFQKYLKSIDWHDKTLLMMSSGNFNGIDFGRLGEEIIKN
jgi:UDP-N-acetylmuramate: L-alanyl-gamma-D-glutamyl-meso-diaminopimelate ligase